MAKVKIPSPTAFPAGASATGSPPDPSVPPTGLVLRDPLPWDQVRQVVETAEETGYGALFVPEISEREAFVTLAAFSLITSTVRLGTGVVSVESRTPRTTALAAGTVHDLSGGRLVLGIGSGGAPPGASTLGRVRTYVEEVRGSLAGASPPIWLGALGDRMVGLAGEVADGVILNWCTPERVARARDVVTRAARAAGRGPGSVTVAVYVRACLGVAETVALEGLREMTGRYAAIPQYARQFDVMGLGEDAAMAAKAFREGRAHEVPEALVRALTVSGGRPEALARFDAYRRAGADVVLCYPVAVLDPFSSILGTLLAAAPSPSVER